MAFKPKLECNLCKKMTEDFFFFNCSETMMAAIVTHLLTCPKCLDYYKQYAKDAGFEWDIMDDVAVFELDDPETKKRIEESLKDFDEYCESEYGKDIKPKDIFIPDKWQQIAKEYDISKLFGMQAFKDLIDEYNGTLDMTDTDYILWYKYIVMKDAKKIDHLECCLRKECTVHEES